MVVIRNRHDGRWSRVTGGRCGFDVTTRCATLGKYQEFEPVGRQMEVPAVIEGGGDQRVEVGDLEAVGIIVVDDLENRVDRVELCRK